MPAAQQMEVSSSRQGTSQGAWTQAGRRLPWQAQFSLWIFFWGSEESRRADAGRGEARGLGLGVGVARGRLESRRPAGIGRADRRRVLTGVLELLTRLCAAEDHLTGVLWATLPTDMQDCGLCARQDFGVAPSGGSPVENPGILN